jgi:hypothetical protein
LFKCKGFSLSEWKGFCLSKYKVFLSKYRLLALRWIFVCHLLSSYPFVFVNCVDIGEIVDLLKLPFIVSKENKFVLFLRKSLRIQNMWQFKISLSTKVLIRSYSVFCFTYIFMCRNN